MVPLPFLIPMPLAFGVPSVVALAAEATTFACCSLWISLRSSLIDSIDSVDSFARRPDGRDIRKASYL